MATTKLVLSPEIEAEYLEIKEKTEGEIRRECKEWRESNNFRLASAMNNHIDISGL